MTPEEFERLKEAEKEHLRKLRKLKKAVRDLERQTRVTRAVQNITEEPRKLFDEQAELVDQIAMDAARSEARLEIAMEESEANAPAALPNAATEEELRRARARELVRQIRIQSGSAPAAPTESPTTAEPEDGGSVEGDTDPGESDPKPEKTIGRMKP